MASQKVTKTGLTLLIDSDVANTLDFHVSSTSLLNIVDEYANYIAATYVFNQQKHTSDPFYNEAQFYWELNNDKLNFKTDTLAGSLSSYSDGRVNPKVYEAFAQGAYLSKLDTLLQDNEVWLRDEANWPESRDPQLGNKQFEITYSTGRKEIVSAKKVSGMNLQASGTTVRELPRDPDDPKDGGKEYLAVNLLTGKVRWVPYDEDMQALVKAKLSTLQDKWGASKMTHEFLEYWTKRFRRAHYRVRELYKGLIDSQGVDQQDILDHFTELSDSIGLLAMTGNPQFADFTMIPIVDYKFEVLGTVPSPVTPVAHSKLDEETQVLINEMSLKTESLYRRNMTNLLRLFKLNDEPHGEDLMTDYPHWSRMIAAQGVLDTTIAETIGKAYKLVGYMETFINEQEIKSPIITMAVEDSLARVDFLKDVLKATKKVTTNSDVLNPVLNYQDQS